MTVGSVLIGVAALAVVAAYVARPFRAAADRDLDRMIEAWVAQVEAGDPESREESERDIESRAPAAAARVMNYCPQCGQPIAQDDRFCSACGAQLRRA